MARNRHNGALVFGALLGGAVGAATALWKTPYSGEELRRMIGLPPSDDGADIGVAGKPQTIGDRALAFVEQATAPIVGVNLGKTANDSQPGPGSTAPTVAGVPADGRISDTEFREFPAQQPLETPATTATTT